MKPLFKLALIIAPVVAAMGWSQSVSADTLRGDDLFDGAYVGFSIGAATADGTTEYPLLAGGTRFAPFDPGTGQGYGTFAGYNFQRDNLIYGVELHYINMVRVADRNSAAQEAREVIELVDLRGRVGYVNGNLMVYGALGYSWAKFRVHPGSGFGPRDNQTNLTGLNVGLGLEYAVNDSWLVGAEYTYRDLNGRFSEATRDTNLDVSNVSLRVIYKF
ncbi:porin family protein [Tropicibacter sp. R16_0]|uniref:outer membrane protein n=1 Tax=Tropicibacter sp. R16_0 TaxID=2821102 RepID=UPI001ADC2A6D|nr:outer membrane beta-barrel protein [Tropicibacter sp. R16_0]MBO9452146.1 porin family protein [Tropicibacter sp. R16_0]